MKYLILLFVLKSASVSQTNDSTIFLKVQKAATFPGGEKEWYKYFSIKLCGMKEYDDWVMSLPKKKKTPIRIRFVVSDLGKISRVEIESEMPDSLKSTIKRVIEESPNWVPAYQDKVAVNSYRKWSWAIKTKK